MTAGLSFHNKSNLTLETRDDVTVMFRFLEAAFKQRTANDVIGTYLSKGDRRDKCVDVLRSLSGAESASHSALDPAGCTERKTIIITI